MLTKGQIEWANVSPQAKERKLINKKSKRDILREVRIEELGGKPIEIQYGYPLSDKVRKQRLDYELDLKFPGRIEKRKTGELQKKQKLNKEYQRPKPRPSGKNRTLKKLIMDNIRQARYRAAELGIPHDITYEDLEVPDRCPILGIKFRWSNKITEETPSLDRVIPELGYVKGNVRIISARANRLKSNATLVELKKLVAYLEKGDSHI